MFMIIHVSSDHLWYFGHFLFGGFKFCGFSGGWSTKDTHAPDVVATIEELSVQWDLEVDESWE